MRLKKRLFFFIFFLICFFFYHLISSQTQVYDEKAEHFLDGIQEIDKMIVYEGLPHQNYEREQLKKEIEHKKIIMIAEYPFYDEPLNLEKEDRQTLEKLLKEKSFYEVFSGEKKCGGFHPDYALAFVKNETKYYVLICFGCREVKLEGSNHVSRHDINSKAFGVLKKVLGQYQKNRPKSSSKTIK